MKKSHHIILFVLTALTSLALFSACAHDVEGSNATQLDLTISARTTSQTQAE